jgi:phage shock protein PspC (stress-responsive transcriptional regulator)
MAQTRKLYRSRTNRKLAGVCGGLSQYFNPTRR